MRFNKEELLKAENTLFKSLKLNKGLLLKLKLKDINGKVYTLDKQSYNGLFESMNIFRIHNGRNPNYVDLISKASNPLVFDHQNNKYNCCPASLSMASQLLYHYKSEDVCAKALGTSTSGTSPDQLINGAKRLGFKVVPIKRNSVSVKSSLSKGYPVITHFQTDQTRKCQGDYIGSFGHYSLIWSMDQDNYIVADPSKSVRRLYRFKCLDLGNKGYRDNYYSVQPL